VERVEARALVAIVGGALVADAGMRERVLCSLNRWQPDLLVQGGSRTSALAVVAADRLGPLVGDLHRSFFEQGAA
jgi:hypothetical protein